MAELRSLLSFMDPEDRREALAMFERLFDEAGEEGEEALIASLGSPVRQVLRIEREFRTRDVVRPAKEENLSFDFPPMPEDEAAAPAPEKDVSAAVEEMPGSAEDILDDITALLAGAAPETEEDASPVETAPEDEAGDPEVEANIPEDEANIPENEARDPEGGPLDGILSELLSETSSAEPERSFVFSEDEDNAASSDGTAFDSSDILVPETERPESLPSLKELDDWMNALEHNLPIVEQAMSSERIKAEEPETPDKGRARPERSGRKRADGNTSPAPEEPELSGKKASGGQILGAVFVSIPMLAFVLIGVALSLALGLIFLALAFIDGVAGIYLIPYVLSGVMTYMPDVLLVAGSTLIFFCLTLLFAWMGLWLIIGGCKLTFRITGSVYRRILGKGDDENE